MEGRWRGVDARGVVWMMCCTGWNFSWNFGARVVVSGGDDDSMLFCDLIARSHADWMCSSPSLCFFRRKVCLSAARVESSFLTTSLFFPRRYFVLWVRLSHSLQNLPLINPSSLTVSDTPSPTPSAGAAGTAPSTGNTKVRHPFFA